MTRGNTTYGQWTGILPQGVDSPTVNTDLAAVANAAEKQSNLWFTTYAAMSAMASPVEGMIAHITTAGDTPSHLGEIWLRTNGAWVKVFPVMYTGTGAPASTLGAVNDVYIQTA